MNNEAQNYIEPIETITDKKQLSELQVAQLHVEAKNKRDIDGVHEATDDALDSLKTSILDNNSEESEMQKSGEIFADVNNASRESISNNNESLDVFTEHENTDNYISKQFQITADEYSQALKDSTVREEVLEKLGGALEELSKNITGTSPMMSGNIFAGYGAGMDKDLITIQEAHIDMQNELRSIV